MSRLGVIEATEPAVCEECGELAELRPYGDNGANICFTCGKKLDPKVLEQRIAKLLWDEDVQ